MACQKRITTEENCYFLSVFFWRRVLNIVVVTLCTRELEIREARYVFEIITTCTAEAKRLNLGGIRRIANTNTGKANLRIPDTCRRKDEDLIRLRTLCSRFVSKLIMLECTITSPYRKTPLLNHKFLIYILLSSYKFEARICVVTIKYDLKARISSETHNRCNKATSKGYSTLN